MTETTPDIVARLHDPRADGHMNSEAANEIERLRGLLERVLQINLAQGCKPGHPRIALVYDIQEALQ